jgi:glycosyltransferase involved in cell wall biosynthesis
MLIGIDACCWGNKRGFGRFTRELLEELLEIDKKNEYLFFIDQQNSELESLPSDVRMIVANTKISPTEAAAAGGRRSVQDLWAMTRAVWRHKVEVFFFPAVYSYFPILNRTKVVVTLHDLIADRHSELIFPDARSKMFWKLKQAAAVRQADIIATVSDYSKRQIAQKFQLPDSRLRVVSEAARPAFRVLSTNNGFEGAISRYGLKLGDRFLLYVGGISPHKNLSKLIDAFAALAAEPANSDLQLILVGDYQDDPFLSAYPSLRHQVDERGIGSKVRFAGFVPDDDLAYLYNAATALVFPSLDEGFGLPAIEAMACGTPVAASDRGSLPEILGTCGRFFDPYDVNDIAKTIRSLISDKDALNTIRTEGLQRASNFTWKKAATETLAIFEECHSN